MTLVSPIIEFVHVSLFVFDERVMDFSEVLLQHLPLYFCSFKLICFFDFSPSLSINCVAFDWMGAFIDIPRFLKKDAIDAANNCAVDLMKPHHLHMIYDVAHFI